MGVCRTTTRRPRRAGLVARGVLAIVCCLAPVAAAQSADPVRTQSSPPAPAPESHNDLTPRPLGLPRDARSTAPGQTAGSSYAWVQSPIIRTTVALAGVLSLILVLAAISKRLMKSNPNFAAAFGAGARSPAGILDVLGRYPIGRGQTLVLLKLDRRILLIGQTGPRLRSGAGSMVTLTEVNDPEDVASILLKVQEAEGDTTADRFRSVLERFDARHSPDGDGVEDVAAGDRNIHVTPDGDRAELWDDHVCPPEHVSSVARSAPVPSNEAQPSAHRSVPVSDGPSLRIAGVDAYADLRSRLAHARAHSGAFNSGGRR